MTPASVLRRLLGKPPRLHDPYARPDPLWSKSLAVAVRAGRATVAPQTYAFPEVVLYDDCTCLHIGPYSSVAVEVRALLGGEHRYDRVTTSPLRVLNGLPGAGTGAHLLPKGDIVIGADVWVGHGATLLPGSRLGNGCVVGAGAVVAGEVPPYAVVAGNRAAVVRYRFDEATRDALQRIAWWEWPLERVIAEVEALTTDDPQSFVRRYDPSGSP